MVNYQIQQQAWEDIKHRGYLAESHVKSRVQAVASVVLKSFPDCTELYLAGSYLKGYYSDGTIMPESIEALRREGCFKEISDIDFLINENIGLPEHMKIFYGALEIYSIEVDIMPLSVFLKEKHLLIWKDGKFVN